LFSPNEEMSALWPACYKATHTRSVSLFFCVKSLYKILTKMLF